MITTALLEIDAQSCGGTATSMLNRHWLAGCHADPAKMLVLRFGVPRSVLSGFKVFRQGGDASHVCNLTLKVLVFLHKFLVGLLVKHPLETASNPRFHPSGYSGPHSD